VCMCVYISVLFIPYNGLEGTFRDFIPLATFGTTTTPSKQVFVNMQKRFVPGTFATQTAVGIILKHVFSPIRNAARRGMYLKYIIF